MSSGTTSRGPWALGSDLHGHWAVSAEGLPYWLVSWLPDVQLDEADARTAMHLADLVAQKESGAAEAWADQSIDMMASELGMPSGGEAIARLAAAEAAGRADEDVMYREYVALRDRGQSEKRERDTEFRTLVADHVGWLRGDPPADLADDADRWFVVSYRPPTGGAHAPTHHAWCEWLTVERNWADMIPGPNGRESEQGARLALPRRWAERFWSIGMVVGSSAGMVPWSDQRPGQDRPDELYLRMHWQLGSGRAES